MTQSKLLHASGPSARCAGHALCWQLVVRNQRKTAGFVAGMLWRGLGAAGGAAYLTQGVRPLQN